jgi:TPR repeat protein
MANYEQMSNSEVQRLAKQGDAEALFEMTYRFDGDPRSVDAYAWRLYWQEKAAKKGHLPACCDYAMNMMGQPAGSLEETQANREIAFKYFKIVSDEYDRTGKSIGTDSEGIGPAAQVGLGTLYCEGISKLDGSDRNPSKGEALIRKNVSPGSLHSFERPLDVGEVYASGYTQDGEVPTDQDLETAVQYLETALRYFDASKNRPQRKEDAEDLLRAVKNRQARRKNEGPENPVHPDRVGRRTSLWTPKGKVVEQAQELAAANQRMRERLRREGWE